MIVRRRHWRSLSALGRNPLVRLSDRLEAIAVLVAIAAIVIAVPVAFHVGSAQSASGSRHLAETLRSLQPVEATVIKAANRSPSRFPAGIRSVQAQWISGFEQRTESVHTYDDVNVGDRVTVWLDAAGGVVEPPQTLGDVSQQGTALGIAVWLTVTLLCVGAVALLVASLDRRRSRAWDHEWRLLTASGGGKANRDR